MNATASAFARIAGVAIVLILAAALGLIAGNVLNARDAGGAGVGAGGASLPHMGGFDGARYDVIQPDAAAAEAPGYADPYRQLIRQGAADAADDTFTQTWGNLDERHDAPSSDETSGDGESLTAPALR